MALAFTEKMDSGGPLRSSVSKCVKHIKRSNCPYATRNASGCLSFDILWLCWCLLFWDVDSLQSNFMLSHLKYIMLHIMTNQREWTVLYSYVSSSRELRWSHSDFLWLSASFIFFLSLSTLRVHWRGEDLRVWRIDHVGKLRLYGQFFATLLSNVIDPSNLMSQSHVMSCQNKYQQANSKL